MVRGETRQGQLGMEDAAAPCTIFTHPTTTARRAEAEKWDDMLVATRGGAALLRKRKGSSGKPNPKASDEASNKKEAAKASVEAKKQDVALSYFS